MDSLHHLVQQGKVLYLGVSGTPAFVVSRANQYARDHGKTPFVVYQGPWNVMQRDIERDIVPMCRMEGGLNPPFFLNIESKSQETLYIRNGHRTMECARRWKVAHGC
jgi:hypothetical protein